MKGALEAMAAQVVNVALAIFIVAIVLGLNAYLEGQPSETDALRISAEISDGLAAEQAAMKGPR